MASSSSSTLQYHGFADWAAQYRIFMLEDLLAEPSELVYDPTREVLYITQRCQQGNAFSPVEHSTSISVLNVSPTSAGYGTYFAPIDISPYSGPNGAEMDTSGAYLFADVENNGEGVKGTICIDLSSQTVMHFQPSGSSSPTAAGSGEFISEVSLQTGNVVRQFDIPKKFKARNNVGTGRFIAFSAAAVSFPSGRPRNQTIALSVTGDSVVQALISLFGIQSLYVTSKNVLLA